MREPFSTRLKIATKALVGLFNERSATEAHGLLSGIYPSLGAVPERGTAELLDGYRTMPWLRAVAYRVAHAVSTTPWVLYRPANGRRDRVVQRAYRGVDRQKLIARAVDEERLVPVNDHILIDALDNANSFLVGPSLFFVTQVHLDLPGEAFWIKERNGLGAPVGFWPIPPHWVRATPTPKHRRFVVAWRGWQGEIPDTEILWFTETNPADPYGRGSGIARALADELETDEYAARHVKMTFLNRARPDLIVWPEETKFDAGTISDTNARRLGEQWRAEHQGFWRAALPFFATRKLGIHEISQNFQELQLNELRKSERDIILQVWGVPPEQLGIIENSNRSTIDTSDYLMKRNVVQPRLDLLRAYLQERLIPEYDDRLIIDYLSPVEEDREFQLKAATAASHTVKVDEWRRMQGLEPLPDGQGQIFMMPATHFPVADPSQAPVRALASVAGPSAAAPTTREAIHVRTVSAEADVALRACLDAGDVESYRAITKALADDPEDLPELSRVASKKEPAVRRLLFDGLTRLRTAADVAAIEKLLDVDGEISDDAIDGVAPLKTWAEVTEDEAREWLADAYRAGAVVGGDAAGLETRAPDPVFNVVNPEAVKWAHRHAGSLIVEIGTATKAGVRASVATALELGWHPTKLARVIRETIGLTSAQAQAVVRFAERLQGDAGVELTDAKFFARVERYAEAQRRLRALTIARTELARSVSTGQQKLWDTAVKSGALKKDRMRKQWLATWDERIEPRCEKLASEQVGIDEPFSNGQQGPPDHPNCRCAAGLVRVEKAIAPPPRLLREAPETDYARIVRESVQAAFDGLGSTETPN